MTALGFAEIEVIDDDLTRWVRTDGGRGLPNRRGGARPRPRSRASPATARLEQYRRRAASSHNVVDQETIYAPRHGNDRLLLGLKGSLNEYELDLLRQRSCRSLRESPSRRDSSWRGRLHQGWRPLRERSGSARPSGDLAGSRQDRGARKARAKRCSGSKSMVLIFRQSGPMAIRSGGSELRHSPQDDQNPIYGCLCLWRNGRNYRDTAKVGRGAKTRCRKARAEWIALRPDAHEGYVSGERFEDSPRDGLQQHPYQSALLHGPETRGRFARRADVCCRCGPRYRAYRGPASDPAL